MRKRQVRLKKDELLDLERLYKDTSRADIRTRCQIILLSGDGLSLSRIGRILGLNHQTIRNWIERYEKEGIPGLYTRKRSGRPPRSPMDI